MTGSVTTLSLAHPLPDDVFVRIRDEFVPRTAAMPGLVGLVIVRPDDLHLALAIFWESPAERDRAVEEVGREFYELLDPLIADASQADGKLLVAFHSTVTSTGA